MSTAKRTSFFKGYGTYPESGGSIEDDPEYICAAPVGAPDREALTSHHGTHVRLDVEVPVAVRAVGKGTV